MPMRNLSQDRVQTTADGTLIVSAGGSATAAAVTSVAVTDASSVTVLAANTAAKGRTIFNEADGDVYVRFGTPASSTTYSVRLATMSYYEVPFGYTGQITARAATGKTGSLRVTELT